MKFCGAIPGRELFQELGEVMERDVQLHACLPHLPPSPRAPCNDTHSDNLPLGMYV